MPAGIAAVRAGGMAAIAELALARFFSPAFVARAPDPADLAEARAQLLAADVSTPPAALAKLGEQLADARLITLPGAGHILNRENPAAVSRGVLVHLDES
ncbi:hypothetical protein [Haliangium ochraceum]|uniref:hypothetical protein n=1 Tax=Haliangium ochraceum TaxID=80816 RepID=UPI00019BA44E|nr:hypothetical protein [Haliangium ochraceum]